MAIVVPRINHYDYYDDCVLSSEASWTELKHNEQNIIGFANLCRRGTWL